MGSIGWYIFRTAFGAFLVVLGSLTPVIWITQALREIDLITTQGQSVFVFLGITSLVVPSLVFIIAPIAMVIAVAHVLNKLGTDSEIIIMNAAGMSPWRVFRAFLGVGLAVTVIMAAISSYVGPKSLRMLRAWMTEARANLVANVMQPGRFTQVESGLTIHIRERLPNGVLAGIVVDDSRNAKERVTIVAEHGEIIENERGTFLVLETGNVQRHEAGQRDPAIVQFERYAFDMSRFSGSNQPVRYTIREEYLWELAFPSPDDPLLKSEPAQFRAEFHDRIAGPLYPIAFVVIVYMYLGAPQTNRQSRALSLVTALALVTLVRLIGFASGVFGINNPAALSMQYIAILTVVGVGSAAISRGMVIEPPEFATRTAALVTRLINRRVPAAAAT
jgi:lipopolysaccharide export system permease protein